MAGSAPTAYLTVPGKIPEYFEKIQRGSAPQRFTTDHLVKIGFKSTNDRALIPLLKSLRFLDESNVPTQAYRDYLNTARGRVVLGRQVLQAYEALFEVERNAHTLKGTDLQGLFKSVANVSDSVAEKMSGTFTRLISLADIEKARDGGNEVAESARQTAETPPTPLVQFAANGHSASSSPPLTFTYTLQINLPNTTDIEVFRAIFKAMQETLVK